MIKAVNSMNLAYPRAYSGARNAFKGREDYDFVEQNDRVITREEYERRQQQIEELSSISHMSRKDLTDMKNNITASDGSWEIYRRYALDNQKINERSYMIEQQRQRMQRDLEKYKDIANAEAQYMSNLSRAKSDAKYLLSVSYLPDEYKKELQDALDQTKGNEFLFMESGQRASMQSQMALMTGDFSHSGANSLNNLMNSFNKLNANTKLQAAIFSARSYLRNLSEKQIEQLRQEQSQLNRKRKTIGQIKEQETSAPLQSSSQLSKAKEQYNAHMQVYDLILDAPKRKIEGLDNFDKFYPYCKNANEVSSITSQDRNNVNGRIKSMLQSKFISEGTKERLTLAQQFWDGKPLSKSGKFLGTTMYMAWIEGVSGKYKANPSWVDKLDLSSMTSDQENIRTILKQQLKEWKGVFRIPDDSVLMNIMRISYFGNTLGSIENVFDNPPKHLMSDAKNVEVGGATILGIAPYENVDKININTMLSIIKFENAVNKMLNYKQRVKSSEEIYQLQETPRNYGGFGDKEKLAYENLELSPLLMGTLVPYIAIRKGINVLNKKIKDATNKIKGE